MPHRLASLGTRYRTGSGELRWWYNDGIDQGLNLALLELLPWWTWLLTAPLVLWAGLRYLPGVIPGGDGPSGTVFALVLTFLMVATGGLAWRAQRRTGGCAATHRPEMPLLCFHVRYSCRLLHLMRSSPA